MLYIIRFKGTDNVAETACDGPTVSEIANLLEKNKIKFKVSNSAGVLSQEHFGFGGYEHWLSNADDKL
jgi:hypothetical protein